MLIGDYVIEKKTFKDIHKIFAEFTSKDFLSLPDRQRSAVINEALLNRILQEPDPSFLLSAVLDFIEKVDKENFLHHYTLNSFELWLNQYSGLDIEKNRYVRGKIAGKYLPREEFQIFFPIGMGKVYEGTHFVTAHKSPDLDTTIASFWGWLDAFSAKVGNSLHIWNVPGGPPSSQIEIDMLFHRMFGEAIFTHLAKDRNLLMLTANDLMIQSNLVRKKPSDTIVQSSHENISQAIVIVDEQGFYKGDWRSIDVESVRQILMLLNNCLRWFENYIHIELVSLFSKNEVKLSEISSFISKIFTLHIKDCEPALEYNDKEKEKLHIFLSEILHVPKGLHASFEEFGKALSAISVVDFAKVQNIVSSVQKEGLFDKSGNFIEDRPLLFSYLEKTIKGLHRAIRSVRQYIERFEIALQIKNYVYQRSSKFVSVRAEVEEIRNKMENYQYLTVTYPDNNRFYPVGVISSSEIRKPILGTVSLRDFCNRDEMSIPSYLEVISVIDHHKTALQTTTPPMAIILDAQSSNSIVGVLSMKMNNSYSTFGLSMEQIEKQLKEKGLSTSLQLSLLNKKAIVEKKSKHFIHPEREIAEYLHFIYGILDDTDLLTKVSDYDVECVVSLLNRLKSLIEGKESSILSLHDIARDNLFAQKAAKRILQNEEMYSLYKKVYKYREQEVEKNIFSCASNKESTFFADTKEQNGCCRVGQTKIFASNYSSFEENEASIRSIWLTNAIKTYELKPEYDLHLHMISTIVSAEEVYKGADITYDHKDSLWVWIPQDEELAVEHLKRFLHAFEASKQTAGIDLTIEFAGEDTAKLEELFSETISSLQIEKKKHFKGPSMAIIRYQAGKLNSRKAQITPSLPKPVL